MARKTAGYAFRANPPYGAKRHYSLVFDEGEREPADDLKLAFEAVSQFDDEDKAVARKVLQSLIMQHHNKQVAAAMQGSSPADRNRPIKDARVAY